MRGDRSHQDKLFLIVVFSSNLAHSLHVPALSHAYTGAAEAAGRVCWRYGRQIFFRFGRGYVTVAAWHNNGKQFCFFPRLPCFPIYLVYPCPLNKYQGTFFALWTISFILHLSYFFTYRVFQSTTFSTIRPHTTFHNLPHFPLFVNLPRLPICPIIWLPHLQSTLFGHPLHISTYSIFQSIAEVCLYFGFACHFTLPCSTLLLCLYSFPVAFLPTKLSRSICIPFRYLRN